MTKAQPWVKTILRDVLLLDELLTQDSQEGTSDDEHFHNISVKQLLKNSNIRSTLCSLFLYPEISHVNADLPADESAAEGSRKKTNNFTSRFISSHVTSTPQRFDHDFHHDGILYIERSSCPTMSVTTSGYFCMQNQRCFSFLQANIFCSNGSELNLNSFFCLLS
jgi:hypothetical protein